MTDRKDNDAISPAAAERAAPVKANPQRRTFAGYTAAQLLVGTAVVGTLVWGMWVTKTITTTHEQKVVRAHLSSIVGEYVQAQARSASPPQKVEAEMRQFMSSIEAEIQKRGEKGEVVLVGEAVLSKNVTDITEPVRKAVYASGVKAPIPASPEELRRLEAPGTPPMPSVQGAAPAMMAPRPQEAGGGVYAGPAQ